MLVKYSNIAFVTFTDTLSAKFKISSHTITDTFKYTNTLLNYTILFKYLLFSQTFALRFQL